VIKSAGKHFQTLILRRTIAGIAQDGRPFEPYRPSTKRKRAAAGLPTGSVNLTQSGRMLRSLRKRNRKKGKDGSIVDFFGPSNANFKRHAILYHGDRPRMEPRRWLWPGDKMLEALADHVERTGPYLKQKSGPAKATRK